MMGEARRDAHPPCPLPMTAVPALDRPLTDGTITLREWVLGDAPAMRRIFLDAEMYRWTDAVPDEPLAEFEDAIRRNWRRRERGDRIALAITDADGGVVGAIDLMMGEFERGEIGYAVGAWVRGNGYATRAVRLLTSWAFETAGVARPSPGVRTRG